MRFIMIMVSLLIFVQLAFSGCHKPQIVSPFSDGFTDNEYLVIKVKDTDQLGLLFEGEQLFDEEGNPIPLKWRQTSIVLFPQSTDVNRIKITDIHQTRNAVEEVKASSKFIATGIAEIGATSDSAYKYQSESSKAHRIITPLKYNPLAKKYMLAQEAKNKNYRFSFMSAIYEGSAFVEVFNNADIKGNSSYAAFQIEGSYYTTENRGIVTSGPIIYQLQPITTGELISPDEKTMGGYKSLDDKELKKIIETLPEDKQFLIDPKL